MTVSGAPIYPTLVAHSGNGGYRWTDGIEAGKILFTETGSSSTTILHPSLYTGVVRTSMEVILPGI